MNSGPSEHHKLISGLCRGVRIIIPTLNEAGNLRVLVPRIRNALPNANVLVVDDSSLDGTAEMARSLGCDVLCRKHKVGLTSAVIDGIEATSEELVIIMDADLQHPPELLPDLLEELGSHDFVAASRYCAGGGVLGWTLKRKVVSRVANLLALLLAPRIKDRTTGFFAFRRSALDGARLDSTGFKISLEILTKGKCESVKEIPYTFAPRTNGDSKYGAEVAIDYVAQLLKLTLRTTILKFATVGASGVVVKLGGTFVLTEFVGLHFMLSYGVAFILSVVNNYVWNSLWTFKGKRSGLVGLGRYFTASTFTLSINEGLLYLLTTILGVWYMLAASMGVFTAFVLNYLFAKAWVWRR